MMLQFLQRPELQLIRIVRVP